MHTGFRGSMQKLKLLKKCVIILKQVWNTKLSKFPPAISQITMSHVTTRVYLRITACSQKPMAVAVFPEAMAAFPE